MAVLCFVAVGGGGCRGGWGRRDSKYIIFIVSYYFSPPGGRFSPSLNGCRGLGKNVKIKLLLKKNIVV